MFFRLLTFIFMISCVFTLKSQNSPNGCLNAYLSERNSLYNELFVKFDKVELSIAEGDFSGSNNYPQFGTTAYVNIPGELRIMRLKAITENINQVQPYRIANIPGHGYKIKVENYHDLDGKPDRYETEYFYIIRPVDNWPLKNTGQIWSKVEGNWIPLAYAESIDKAFYFSFLHNAVFRYKTLFKEADNVTVYNDWVLNLALSIQSMSQNCVTPQKVVRCFNNAENKMYLKNSYVVEKLIRAIVFYQSTHENINTVKVDDFEERFTQDYLYRLNLKEDTEGVVNSIACSFIMDR